MNLHFKTNPGKPLNMKMKKTPLLTVLRYCLALLLLAFALPATRSQAATYNPPQLMSYQGYVTDGSGNPLGSTNTGPKNYNIVFRIWDIQTGGTTNGSDELYAEQQTVTVNNGYFSVLLGQGTSYANEPHTNALSGLFTPASPPSRYVEITVLGIGVAGANITIFPRLQLLSSPYSFLAANAVNAFNAATLVNSNNTPTVSIAANGDVGVGTTTPDQELTVAGSADIQGSASIAGGANIGGSASITGTLTVGGGASFAGSGSFDNFLGCYGVSGSDDLFSLYNENGDEFNEALVWNPNDYSVGSAFGDVVLQNDEGRLMLQTGYGSSGLTIDYNNHVGIGTNYAAFPLDVNGRMELVGTPTTSAGEWLTDSSLGPRAFIGLDGPGYVGLWGNKGQGWGMIMNVTNGFVGINTGTPQAGLDVETGGYIYRSYSYFEQGSVSTAVTTGQSPGITIYTFGGMGATIYYAFSDARIKNIIGVSSGAKDLNTLRGIQVTDFTYKDVIAKGTNQVKKVIAQQVEKVFPQAVNKGQGVVPDIYKSAPVTDGWVQLATDLHVGDRVRLISDSDASVHEVLAITKDGFRTDLPATTHQIFVYGREVNDFRTVDYDAISMLNVSATQELANRLDQKSAQVDILAREVADLKKLVTQLADAAKNSKLTASAAAAQTSPVTTASLDR